MNDRIVTFASKNIKTASTMPAWIVGWQMLKVYASLSDLLIAILVPLGAVGVMI